MNFFAKVKMVQISVGYRCQAVRWLMNPSLLLQRMKRAIAELDMMVQSGRYLTTREMSEHILSALGDCFLLLVRSLWEGIQDLARRLSISRAI
jgi:hypothetical protein